MKQKVKDIIMIRVLNAIAVAGITFFSSLSVSYPPTLNNIYASLIAFALTFLVQIKAMTDDLLAVMNKPITKSTIGKDKGGDKEDKPGSRFLMLL